MSLSFWERSRSIPHQDLIVIGSGITGIQAAIAAKKKQPTWRITVLERGPFPAGASTKNAGFACIGSLSEIVEDFSKIGEARTFALMEKRYRGLQLLREQVGDKDLDFHPCGGIELFRSSDLDIYDASCNISDQVNEAIHQFSGVKKTFSQGRNVTSFNTVHNIWYSSIEGQLDPFKMMKSLLLQARKMGIQIQTAADVTEIITTGGKISLETKFLGILTCDQVVVATNGFTKKLLPGLAVRPVRNQVLITSEISDLGWEGTFHYDRGYVYFRNVGKRVLLGGFRNVGGTAEETDQFGLTNVLQDQLTTFLREEILPNREIEIEHQWSGILGVGESKEPIVEEALPGVFVAVRLGGMGVALGSFLGQEIAEMIG